MSNLELWEHQKEGVRRALSQPNFGFFFSVGTGKTCTVIHTIRGRFNQTGRIMRTLVVAPLIVVENWKREFAKFAPTVPQSKVIALTGTGANKAKIVKKNIGYDCIMVVNYDALQNEELLAALLEWSPEILIADECFLEGTLIDTPRGKVKIEDIRVGDKIYNCTGIDTVTDTFKTIKNEILEISCMGGAFFCSKEHPFLTIEGWKKAEDLHAGDLLISTDEAMRLLQQRFHSTLQESRNSALLLRELRIEKPQPSNSSEDAQSKPYASAKSAGESIQHIARNETQAISTWWKWSWADRAGETTDELSPRSRVERGGHWLGRNSWLPNKLQIGSWLRKSQTWCRSGWVFTLSFKTQGTGQKEAGVSKLFRVDYIKIHQQTGARESKGYSCYDLSVEKHPSYSVNGVLVHNCQRLKSPTSKRTKNCAKLRQSCKFAYILSGTPILKSKLDLFGQFLILDNGASFGTNFFKFRLKWFVDKNVHMPRAKHFPNFVERTEMSQYFADIVDKSTLAVKKETCLDLPPLIRQTVYVELGKDQSRVYKELERHFIAFLDDETCAAPLAITKGLRMQQVLSGHLPMDNGEVVTFDDNPRATALEELLEDIAPHHKVIVWCVWKEDYKQVRAICTKLKLESRELHGEIPNKDRVQFMDDFNGNDKVRVLIGNPVACGLGVNLVAASYSIYYSRNYSLENDLQSMARNYRFGSGVHDKVVRIDIVAKDTLDEVVLESLAAKEEIGLKTLRYYAKKSCNK